MYDAKNSEPTGKSMLPDAPPLKFWESESFFKCPVVGLCLTSAEQKKILKKTGVSLKNGNLYEIHEVLVACAETENKVSRKTDQILARKYSSRVSSLYAMNEEEFMDHWRVSFKTGCYASVLWAAVTRRHLSGGAKREIFGTIHMSMHTTAENHAHDRQQLELLRNEFSRQAREMRAVIATRVELQRENDSIKRALTGLQSELETAGKANNILRNEIERLENRDRISGLHAENQVLHAELAEKTKQIDAQNLTLNEFKRRITDLTVELESWQLEYGLLQQEAQEALRNFLQVSRCDTACPVFDLCRKRVLIVGGIARMGKLYRRLVEDRGGIFEYHDGHLGGGARQLENSLKRADIVLCPVNCNSHAACSLVKNLGKKHNKPTHMLSNFSLSAVVQVLGEGGKHGAWREQI